MALYWEPEDRYTRTEVDAAEFERYRDDYDPMDDYDADDDGFIRSAEPQFDFDPYSPTNHPF